MKLTFLTLLALMVNLATWADETPQWGKHEISFTSVKEYDNPVYDVRNFQVTFKAPSGRTRTVGGFWNGGTDWKVRFMPDETGLWSWESKCSDEKNQGLHGLKGSFICISNPSRHDLFQKGAIVTRPGLYHFLHTDGTPFFWLACTAWNGALKSTPEEWDYYLRQRAENHYNVIQLVTTEWRGCDKNPEGETAIEGTGYIRIHPSFFKRIDERIDEANRQGFLVSPVILWALPTGAGRYLSPGYTLPLEEAILLARYIVARYQGNHVVWSLGGDGRYTTDQEMKWKEIGRQVFNGIDHSPVTLHPQGSSWVGESFAPEEWYGMMGYQSSHSNGEGTVNWINKGPVSKMWSKLKPMPYINMEPNYEEIRNVITDKDVRNASYWSLFATPVAGITYGANGIWPWLREGEKILNHGDSRGTSTWKKSIAFPGSIQMGYLYGLFTQFEWWRLMPANELLGSQPGTAVYNQWISVLADKERSLILLYIPSKGEVELKNPFNIVYSARWFDPISNAYEPATLVQSEGRIKASHTFGNDRVLILEKASRK